LWVPHHSPPSGAAMIGQVKFPSLISQIPGEKLSVAPPANFTTRQHQQRTQTAACVPLDNTPIRPT
jgi:hypothetical protein